MLSHRKPEPHTEKPDLSQRGQAVKREGGPLQIGRPIHREVPFPTEVGHLIERLAACVKGQNSVWEAFLREAY